MNESASSKLVSISEGCDGLLCMITDSSPERAQAILNLSDPRLNPSASHDQENELMMQACEDGSPASRQCNPGTRLSNDAKDVKTVQRSRAQRRELINNNASG